jgi:hypothetical protein
MVDLKSRRGNVFAFTDWTASRSIQPSSFLESKPTLFTTGSFHDKALRMDRLGNMLKMIKDFSFFNPEPFRNFLQIETFFLQDFGNLLPQG